MQRRTTTEWSDPNLGPELLVSLLQADKGLAKRLEELHDACRHILGFLCREGRERRCLLVGAWGFPIPRAHGGDSIRPGQCWLGCAEQPAALLLAPPCHGRGDSGSRGRRLSHGGKLEGPNPQFRTRSQRRGRILGQALPI